MQESEVMGLSLKQSQAVAELAHYVYDFLPGKPHPYADQTISFQGVAQEVGLARFWSGGSKEPAVAQLFTRTLEYQERDFVRLIVLMVRRGIVYRQNKGDPITREEIEGLNGIITRVGFKFRELHDPKFLDTLPRDPSVRADLPPKSADPGTLARLQRKFLEVSCLPPAARGTAFEKFLNDLFTAYGLSPRNPFRITGEQIDGSFELGQDTYLLEAKWEGPRVGQEQLLVFSGKVGGKSQWSRGLFISMSGYTDEGLEAFARGKPTNIICFEALCLHHTVSGHLDLGAVIRRKARRAAETNAAFVPVRDLFSGVT
jgi:hypothetical protein